MQINEWGINWFGIWIWRSRHPIFSNNNISVQNYIETHSCFDKLIFHALVILLTEVLTIHKEFKDNLNFHHNSEGFTLSYN